MSVGQTLS